MPDLPVDRRQADRGPTPLAPERQHQPRKIGILGGMGPLATTDLYRKLILATSATRDQDHLPVVIAADSRIPDRTAALRGEGPDPLPYLVAGATRLRDAGAEIGLIVCNTAHAFLPALRERVALDFLDMIAETATRVAIDYPQVRRVGLLATRGTIETRLYHRALEARDIETITLDSVAQEHLIDGGIALVKAGDPGPEPGDRLAEAARRLVAAGAEAVLAACTEIPLVLTPGQYRCGCSTRRRSWPKRRYARRAMGRPERARSRRNERRSMMVMDGERRLVTHRYPCSTMPNRRREDVLNRLCEVREDPRFAEWCRLTSALGLDRLTLSQLAALHAGSGEVSFPEVSAWGQVDDSALLGYPYDGQDGAADIVFDDGATPGSSLTEFQQPGLEWYAPPVGGGDGVFDGQVMAGPAADRRTG